MPRIDHDHYLEIIRNATVIEADVHGDKVLRLAHGDYLKLFRVKRLFSSARIVSYAERFMRNARLLASLGVNTVTIVATYNIPSLQRSAVRYQPLPGNTVRSIAATLNAPAATQLGQFVRELHDKGIYFRSLHLGNIVLTPDKRFGLIDISDLKIYRRPLGRHRRIRNFRHLFRIAADQNTIARYMDSFATGYNDADLVSAMQRKYLLPQQQAPR